MKKSELTAKEKVSEKTEAPDACVFSCSTVSLRQITIIIIS